MLQIRSEKRGDIAAVRQLNLAAFEGEEEAKLVELLRAGATPLISLVAEDNEELVGHIMFSPVELGAHRQLKIFGLAPMAVLPQRQSQGIGSALVRAGIEECKKLGAGAIVVLGHPNYYPRFGFRPTSEFGINSEYDVPPEVFMLLQLEPDYLHGATGVIKYHQAFSQL